MSLRIGSVVLRVADLPLQMAFWCAALDYVPREPPTEDWVVLRPRAGGGPNLSLDASFSRYALPPRLHLDVYTHDQGTEVARLIALGAREVDVPKRPADADWRLLEDPERLRFDVVQLPADGLE